MKNLILTLRLVSIAGFAGIVAGSSLAAAQATVPNAFAIGDLIDADEMNDNFTAVMDAVDTIALTPGPQGPAGNDGAAGAQGPMGPMGPMGLPGPIGLPGSNGAPGAPGMNGTDGADGAAGAAGIDGFTSLITVTAEPAGSNCMTGGSKFDVGLDDSRDGTLDVGEIDSTAYACNAVNGEAPVNSYTGGGQTVYEMAARPVPSGDLKDWYQGLCEDAGLAPVSCDSTYYSSAYDASAWGAVALDQPHYGCNVSSGVTGKTGWTPVLTFHVPLGDTLGVYCTNGSSCSGNVSPVCTDQPLLR